MSSDRSAVASNQKQNAGSTTLNTTLPQCSKSDYQVLTEIIVALETELATMKEKTEWCKLRLDLINVDLSKKMVELTREAKQIIDTHNGSDEAQQKLNKEIKKLKATLKQMNNQSINSLAKVVLKRKESSIKQVKSPQRTLTASSHSSVCTISNALRQASPTYAAAHEAEQLFATQDCNDDETQQKLVNLVSAKKTTSKLSIQKDAIFLLKLATDDITKILQNFFVGQAIKFKTFALIETPKQLYIFGMQTHIPTLLVVKRPNFISDLPFAFGEIQDTHPLFKELDGFIRTQLTVFADSKKIGEQQMDNQYLSQSICCFKRAATLFAKKRELLSMSCPSLTPNEDIQSLPLTRSLTN